MDEAKMSPVPMPPPKKEEEIGRLGTFIVWKKEEIGKVFHTFAEAMAVAESFAMQHGKTVLVFEQVGGYIAETQTRLKKIAPKLSG